MLKKITILLIFVLCWTYIGIIGAVTIHEILGHGLAYKLVGYEFTAFTLKPDGMGWAESNMWYDNILIPTPSQEIFVLLAGPVSTYIFALFFFILAFIFRKRFWIPLALTLLGLTNLLDGGPYMLWSSYVNSGDGDFARVLAYIPEYRIVFLILGTLITIGGIIFSIYFIFKLLFKWLGDFSTKKYLILGIIFLASSIPWFTFDWNQLAPGVGYLPQYLAIIVNLITVTFIGMINQKPITDIVVSEKWIAALTITIAIFITTLLSILIWFQYGINLSKIN